METNDLMRRLRYAMALDDRSTARIIGLGGGDADVEHVAIWRSKPDDPYHQICPAQAITQLLAGLVIDRRGPPPPHLASRAVPGSTSDNNQILKQLRIALQLKDDDVHSLIEGGGGRLSRSEVNALFRKPGARNYRACGDQVLRWFLAGLAATRESENGRSS